MYVFQAAAEKPGAGTLHACPCCSCECRPHRLVRRNAARGTDW